MGDGIHRISRIPSVPRASSIPSISSIPRVCARADLQSGRTEYQDLQSCHSNLFQFEQCFSYSPECLADVVVAGGVAHAETFRVAEGVASDGGHVCLFEEIQCEVGGVGDGFPVAALAVEAAAFGEEVEGAFRGVHLQPWYAFGEFHDEVSPSLEGLPHFLHTFL